MERRFFIVNGVATLVTGGRQDAFGTSMHVSVAFRDRQGDYVFGWFPLDLWEQLPTEAPQGVVIKPL